jgi:riboflavin kinase/FMN adenylyltransferase
LITIRGEKDLQRLPNGSVISIGVFDGVHLGHQAILGRNIAVARELGAIPTVVTFRGHPKLVILGRAPKILTTIDHRLELFDRAGIGCAVVLEFTEELRSMSAEQFVERICVRGLGVRRFVLGFDSKFGRDREGTPDMLRKLGHDTEVVSKVIVAGRAVSSTAIREAVELGDLQAAKAMLGRPVSVFGKVVHGESLGRRIGFPTANLDLRRGLHPPPGVYACRAHWMREGRETSVHQAVTNIGYRPTLHETTPETPRVEVHLLDFEGELYGERIELEFVTALRGEERFPSLDALAAQIKKDVERARWVLSEGPVDGPPSHGNNPPSRSEPGG